MGSATLTHTNNPYLLASLVIDVSGRKEWFRLRVPGFQPKSPFNFPLCFCKTLLCLLLGGNGYLVSVQCFSKLAVLRRFEFLFDEIRGVVFRTRTC